MLRRLSAFLFAAAILPAQDRAAVENWVAAHQQPIIRELADLVAIPNVARDRDGIRRNAGHLKLMLERRGLAAEILETTGNPLVYGEKKVPGAARTILYYIHYDGQPVDPSKWKQPGPFQPILRDGRMEDGAKEIAAFASLARFDDNWRLYGRSTSDDKAPIVAFCAALDAIGGKPSANVRVVLDGEEEASSPSLAPAVARYRDKFRADLLIVLDGPEHATGKPTLSFGGRGEVSLELTVYGPEFALHSGHYGNWIPNPAIRLAQLLASMKDEQGRTTIQGFYDSVPPLTAEDRRILKAVPDDETALLHLFGVAKPDAVGESLQEAIQFPSLNVRGMHSGYVGADARTIIPADAVAAIDIRLVKEAPGEAQIGRVLAHIRRQGWQIVDANPDDAARLRYPKLVRIARGEITEAYRTEMTNPEAVRLTQALERAWGEAPVRVRTMGGTVPITQFIRELGFPAVALPIVNFDNNQHSENENLRLGHLWRGIVSLAATLRM
jgi:acetylornithine deacetylase/succinyl-diaminopimelate desuccinylase-like protein